MAKSIIRVLIFGLLFISYMPSAMAKEVYVPPALSEWTKWIMHDKEEFSCPPSYNNSDERICFWPGILEIKADEKGSSFTQNWTVKTEGFVTIPGDSEIWPQNVTANDTPVAVTNQEGAPSVLLKPGDYKISGSFAWKEIPQRIKIPDSTGLLNLSINGEAKKSPVIDASGFLWLKEVGSEKEEKKAENRLDIKIFRMLEDKSPLEITTLIQLSISGEVRKETLTPETLIKGSFPAAISSPLPLKIDEKGEIRFEARPGRWNVEIKSIIEKTPENEILTSAPFGPETWTFRPHPELRNIKIEGGIPVDPSQTTMPDEWRSFSSYMLKKDEGLALREIKRGSASLTEGDLNLFRDFWLDFDGKGAVIRDQIKGRLDRRFFLGLEKEDYTLGRVTSGGRDQLITELGKDLGIEMEKGGIDFSAVSRMERVASGKTFPLGWNIRFQNADGNLHIPPGWRLLAIKGGSAPDHSTWIDRWTLLDFFAVLIISVAVAKLWRIWWGLIFFFGLTLISHEPFAPKSVWIFITITAAISALIEKGGVKSRKAELGARICHILACILLAGSGIMFCYTQIRLAIYPQLEKPWIISPYLNAGIAEGKKDKKMEMPRTMAKSAPAPAAPMLERKKQALPAEAMDKEEGVMDELVQNDAAPEARAGAEPEQTFSYSLEPQEQAITQTGPGLPEWAWTTVPVKFGLTGGSHKFTLWLSPPLVNAVAGFVRVIFFLILASRFMGMKMTKVMKSGPQIPQVAIIAGLALVMTLSMPLTSKASDIPGPELLKQLEERLLEPAPCFPECASMPYLKITTAPDSKGAEVVMDINSAITTAVPLPRSTETWEISSVTGPGTKIPSLMKKNGDTWILVNEGASRFTMNISFKSSTAVRFSFPIKPMLVAVNAYGWNVSGIDENQQVPTELVFSRISEKQPEPGDEFSETASSLKGYMRIVRTINLGIEWKMTTRAERIFTTGGPSAISAEIPLINGEIIHNPRVKAKDGLARVEIGPGENSIEWASTIPVSPEIRMQIPENADWGESWQLNASSLWHISSEGVPEVHRDGQPGTFWYPRPGETIVINAKKLEPAKGESTTIDSVNIDYHTGEEFSRIVLDARIRTSEGGVLPVKSPEGAKLKNIRINGNTIPLTETSGRLNIPLQPGNQNLNIEWTEKPVEKGLVAEIFNPRLIKLPEIGLGKPSSNITINMHLPDRMWLLFTHGPRLGPAVLFWGYLIIIIAGGLILGKYSPIPVKTRDWVLLGIGLAPLGPGSIIFTVIWFASVHFRKSRQPERLIFFRLMQVSFFIATIIMIGILYSAIKNGLLGIPDMQVMGNGSSAMLLRWTLDRSGEILPRPWTAMVSIYVFRMLMFVWAAWLAFKVTEWAKLSYSAFRQGGVWQKD